MLLLILVLGAELLRVASPPRQEHFLQLLPFREPCLLSDEVSRQLSDMYEKELRLKYSIAEELAHTTDHDLTLSYLSLWLHQPYVESDSKLLLESMLLETGHRAL